MTNRSFSVNNRFSFCVLVNQEQNRGGSLTMLRKVFNNKKKAVTEFKRLCESISGEIFLLQGQFGPYCFEETHFILSRHENCFI